MMTEKSYTTSCGIIRYWINIIDNPSVITLIFLPGLTADHRLFDKQIEYFKNKYNLFVWDAPGHASSYPFSLDFTLHDKAKWLNEIISAEHIVNPVIVGQSMGGYLGQAYSQMYPDSLKGFISIDSAPLQRRYYTSLEIWLLKRMEPIYRHYNWKLLLKQGSYGVATSIYGRELMRKMMLEYDGNQERYAKLSGHGYRMLAEAVELDLPYTIHCPALLLCGDKDRAGSCVRYNKTWHRHSGIRLEWIKDAGHNSNTDQPETVNKLIEEFVDLTLSGSSM